MDPFVPISLHTLPLQRAAYVQQNSLTIHRLQLGKGGFGSFLLLKGMFKQ